MPGGFNGLPKVNALIRRNPASARALSTTVPAADVQFDEDGRRILSAPLQPLPRATATVAPPGGFTRIPNPPPKLPAYTGPAKRPSPAKDAPDYPRNADGVRKTGRRQPDEIPTLGPEDIPY